AIETVDLVKRFPAQQGWRSLVSRKEEKIALGGVNISAAPGEILGLLGPNGAGKTTLVKVLSTLLLPSAGKAYVAGLDVETTSVAVRARVGVVYGDERAFFWRLSGFENLMFYASLYKIPKAVAAERIESLLDFVRLREAGHVRMSN